METASPYYRTPTVRSRTRSPWPATIPAPSEATQNTSAPFSAPTATGHKSVSSAMADAHASSSPRCAACVALCPPLQYTCLGTQCGQHSATPTATQPKLTVRRPHPVLSMLTETVTTFQTTCRGLSNATGIRHSLKGIQVTPRDCINYRHTPLRRPVPPVQRCARSLYCQPQTMANAVVPPPTQPVHSLPWGILISPRPAPGRCAAYGTTGHTGYRHSAGRIAQRNLR